MMNGNIILFFCGLAKAFYRLEASFSSSTSRRIVHPLRATPPLVNSKSIEPIADELTNENLVRIVREECTDDQVNELVWKCLGYRRRDDGTFDNEQVFPKWREKYPSPPDLIGITRTYSKEIDEPVLRANQALVNSIPMKYKGGIKHHLAKVGWTGFMLQGLTPNKTRRAQCTNWLLYYREALFGISLEELIVQKERNVAAENQRLREEGKALRIVGPDGDVKCES
eukprot:CAMPEP_0197318538 /NCGR_PEP_ID=MMETSP0891-20130614/51489_1 /TAXON_ID=44058 ORGANISM="Aureoumbra lagunensis, Strain CCMP1510" /NCGR_SAMPLE_ID=MMETSP0891 /ASSEMBLY_ACC=CAM_ASM_000534 /LENGTH=225 /DNA_ID=CAMNT_0042809051 /DNA_START=24 /DNA_END=701 /DNA_ORIENTATION=-